MNPITTPGASSIFKSESQTKDELLTSIAALVIFALVIVVL